MHSRSLALSLLLALAASALAQSPALTTVQGQLHGTAVTIRVVAVQTFITADGYVVPRGYTVASASAKGVISLQLLPNAGSTPSGSYYMAYYTTPTIIFAETWIVPKSASPVPLAAVRALQPSSLSYMLPFSLIKTPGGCAENESIELSSTGLVCRRRD